MFSCVFVLTKKYFFLYKLAYNFLGYFARLNLRFHSAFHNEDESRVAKGFVNAYEKLDLPNGYEDKYPDYYEPKILG